MISHTVKHVRPANITFTVLLTVFLITAAAVTTSAKPLYVIADKIFADEGGIPYPLQVYNIGADGTLSLQGEYYFPIYEYGPVGLAVDSDSKYLFVTHQESNIIQIINATKMKAAGTATAPGAASLFGIIYDHDKKRLYCVDRHTDKLHVFDWNANTITLTPVQDSPFTIADARAYEIALDEANDLLYVATNWTIIRVYDTSTWSLVDAIDTGCTTVSVALDQISCFLYLGGGLTYIDYLTQYNLATGTTRSRLPESDAGVFGIAVDSDTGFVYITTGRTGLPGGDNIKVYNANFKEIQSIHLEGKNPTDLVIPNNDINIITYNPLFLSKSIVETSLDEEGKVPIGGTIVYNICFNNKSNNYSVTNVKITDTLPNEVSFLTADGDGVFGHYDPATHTYTWSYASLPAGSEDICLKLFVQIDPDTPPGVTITNSATIESDETGASGMEPSQSSVNVVTRAVSSNPLNLSKNIFKGAVEQNVNGEVEYVTISDTLIYSICFNNKDNNQNVTNVSIVDYLPDEVSFVTADGDGVFGQYNPTKHTYTWTYPSLPARSADVCLKLVVQINQNTSPGTKITNHATIMGNEAGTTTASVEVTTAGEPTGYNPLNLTKSISIINGASEQKVGGNLENVVVSDILIYRICFNNRDNNQGVTNVSIIDTLPDEVSFIMADGDGTFGQYDPTTHTYTWTYSSLLPNSADVCLRLVAQVNQNAVSGTIITNFTTIGSNETAPVTASVDALICDGS